MSPASLAYRRDARLYARIDALATPADQIPGRRRGRVAVAAGLSFVRLEGFAYGHVADDGWIEASAGPLLRARAALGAQVKVWADVKKKHSAHAATGDLSPGEVVPSGKSPTQSPSSRTSWIFLLILAV